MGKTKFLPPPILSALFGHFSKTLCQVHVECLKSLILGRETQFQSLEGPPLVISFLSPFLLHKADEAFRLYYQRFLFLKKCTKKARKIWGEISLPIFLNSKNGSQFRPACKNPERNLSLYSQKASLAFGRRTIG